MRALITTGVKSAKRISKLSAKKNNLSPAWVRRASKIHNRWTDAIEKPGSLSSDRRRNDRATVWSQNRSLHGSLVVQVASSSSNLTLSWPLASAGFQLQARTNLVEGNWIDVTSPVPQLTGDHWTVNIPLNDFGTAFYRLSK
jgi:hypothetical protein